MQISKFSDKIKNNIFNQYISGEKISDLCDEHQISRSHLYRLIKNNKIHKRRNGKTINFHELYQLERKVEFLQIENEIFKKSGCGINSSNEEKIKAVDTLKDDYTVYAVCKTLDLLRSTYYHHLLRAPKQKWNEIRNDMLRPKIIEIFEKSKERFGAGKISVKLREQDIIAHKTLISKLMKEMGLVSKQNRLRMHNTTNRSSKYRKNRLMQNFDQEHPNTYWVSDVTYMLTKESDVYTCVIIDLYSRKVIAYGVSNKNDTDLVLSTFKKAYEERDCPKGLTFHSDQGATYTSYEFRKHLRDLGVLQSFSNPGTPYDNAVAEAFFSIMKRESLSHKWYETVKELEEDVAEFISFFNTYRPLAKLGNISPDEYEKKYIGALKTEESEDNLLKEFFQRMEDDE